MSASKKEKTKSTPVEQKKETLEINEEIIDNHFEKRLEEALERLSKIEDADFALETAKLTKAQIMSNVASSILAQANANSNIFLKLIN